MYISRLITIFIVSLLMTQSIRADDIRRIHRFPRSLAMGEAFTAVADSEETIAYNAAGLLIKDVEWSLSFPIIWFAYDELIRKAMVGDVDFDFEDEGFLEDIPGTRAYIELQIGFPFWFHPESGNYLGISGNLWLELIFPSQTVIPTVIIESVKQYTAEYGTAWELWDSDLYIGTDIKAIKREGLIAEVSLLSVSNLDYNDLVTEYASNPPPVKYSADVGLLYRFEGAWKPRLGMSFLDLGGVDFGEVGELKQFNSLGFAATQIYKDFNFTYSMDFHDFTYTYFPYDDYTRRLAFGFEAALGKNPDNSSTFAIQLGLKELGLFSYGLSTKLGYFETSLAYWEENYGTPSKKKIDKRYMIQMAAVF